MPWAWKINDKSFTLQWFSSKIKWNLWFLKKPVFEHEIEEENPQLFEQRFLSRLILNFFRRPSSQFPTLDMVFSCEFCEICESLLRNDMIMVITFWKILVCPGILFLSWKILEKSQNKENILKMSCNF